MYEVGKRFELKLTLKGAYEYTKSFGWTVSDATIYKFVDDSNNILIWNTTSVLGIDREDADGNLVFEGVNVGDSCTIKATIKEFSEYKGEEQVVLNRCKVVSIEHAPKKMTKEEFFELKRKEQLDSISDGDFIWNMTYKQFKEHYDDCETLANSFYYEGGKAYISVIIRNGRLKNSGVRGMHFRGYQFENELGEKITYRAVSEENANKRVVKEYPQFTWECVKIFNYNI